MEETHLEGCFGALNDAQQAGGNYTQDWFDRAYDELCQRMGKAVLFALERQLNESYRQSIVAAPMQLRQLKDDIGFYLSELLAAKTDADSYRFRGFFFVNVDSSNHVQDPLTKQVAYQLDHHEMVVPKPRKLSQSFFVNELFNLYIRPEAGLAEVNRLRRRLHIVLLTLFTVFILSLLGGTVWLFNANSEFYHHLNEASLRKLDAYKKRVQQRPYAKDTLFENVTKLNVLRDIHRRYQKTPPFYISDLVPNPSVSDALQKAYHEELSNYLLPALVANLESRLRSYRQSGEVLQTASALSLVKSLQARTEQGWTEVKRHYRQTGKQQGEENQTRILLPLMDDLYSMGLPKVSIDQRLISDAETFIHQMNSSAVLYQYIKGLPQFSGTVDVGSQLGSHFSQLFRLTNTVSLDVPYLFTPQGFAALDLHPQSPLVSEVLQNNKALLGDSLSEYQINSLVQQILRLYQREYINYWLSFIDNIAFNALTEETLSAHLTLLTQKADAPLSQLYDVISYHTSPELQVLQADEPQDAGLREKAESLLKGSKQAPLTPTADQVAMAKAIRDEFAVYHDFVRSDEQGISLLSDWVNRVTKVKSWRDNVTQHNDIGAQYFQELTTADKDQSLYQLTQIQSGIATIDSYRTTLVELMNRDVDDEVRQYLEGQWQKQVYQPFTQNFSAKFPFDLSSERDVDVKLFNRYFKTGGLFDTYREQVFSQFKSRDGQRFISGFVPGNNIYISDAVLVQFEHLSEIQRVVYQLGENRLSVPFKLSVKEMSADVVKFELFSQRTLMVYQHGPKLWYDFSWPDSPARRELLATFTNTEGQTRTLTYAGDWAWLRMIYQHYQSSQNYTEVKLVAQDQQISLLLNVTSDENPLEPTFFSRFRLPATLL